MNQRILTPESPSRQSVTLTEKCILPSDVDSLSDSDFSSSIVSANISDMFARSRNAVETLSPRAYSEDGLTS